MLRIYKFLIGIGVGSFFDESIGRMAKEDCKNPLNMVF